MIPKNPPEYLLLAVEGIDWYTFNIALEFGTVE